MTLFDQYLINNLYRSIFLNCRLPSVAHLAKSAELSNLEGCKLLISGRHGKWHEVGCVLRDRFG